MTVTLLDTGVLYAAIDRSDAHHEVSARLLSTLPGRLLRAFRIELRIEDVRASGERE